MADYIENEATSINDGDYILADKAGWFETNGVSVRIFTDNHGVVRVSAYRVGHEMDDPIDEMAIEI